MVGKPNFRSDAEVRSGKGGAISQPTPGLTPLDKVREASMADEGGAAGALMESAGDERPRVLDDDHHHDMGKGGASRWSRLRVPAEWMNTRVLAGAGIGAAMALGFLLVRSRQR
jgi:hypothetical protein